MTTQTSISEGARDQVRLLKELSESLNQAIGGSTQLAHSMRAPQFLMIRQALELMREGIMEVTTFQTKKVTPKAGV